MKALNKILILAMGLTFFNCSSGGSGDDGPGPTPVNPPTAATLQFPQNNSECTEGTNITTTQSTINFDWADASNTVSYQLVLKNLETQSSTNHNSTVSEIAVSIPRGTPFSWYVISKNSGTQTAQSATWKFYNAGVAATSYSPFPAELVSPTMGSSLNAATTSVTLDWEGSDVDGDITFYELFFGTNSNPTSSQGSSAESSKSVSVSSGNTYYWKVVTKDSQNNSSGSEVFQFKVSN